MSIVYVATIALTFFCHPTQYLLNCWNYEINLNFFFLFVLANKPHLNKQFPNVSSESDLQRYKTAHSHERKSPSLSNPTDSIKQKVHKHLFCFYVTLRFICSVVTFLLLFYSCLAFACLSRNLLSLIRIILYNIKFEDTF